MTYVVRGLDPSPYRPLYGMTDDELAGRGVARMTVTEKPSFPCRISLKDREIGETVLLLNHVSLDVEGPYRASHAIFVTEGELERAENVDRLPPVFATRMLSLRAFDAQGMMVEAALAQPGKAEESIEALFADPAVETIHAHNAVRGCFAAKIERN
jgi:hypothetical protein